MRSPTRPMVIALLAALVALGLVALLLSGRRPAPPASPPVAAFKPSGNYAGDWQARCAPLAGPAQAACTAGLDAAYGKADAAPVPSGGGY